MQNTKPTIIRYTPLDEWEILIVAAYGSDCAVQHYRRVTLASENTMLLAEHVGGTEWCLAKFNDMLETFTNS